MYIASSRIFHRERNEALARLGAILSYAFEAQAVYCVDLRAWKLKDSIRLAGAICVF